MRAWKRESTSSLDRESVRNLLASCSDLLIRPTPGMLLKSPVTWNEFGGLLAQRAPRVLLLELLLLIVVQSGCETSVGKGIAVNVCSKIVVRHLKKTGLVFPH